MPFGRVESGDSAFRARLWLGLRGIDGNLGRLAPFVPASPERRKAGDHEPLFD